MVHTQTTPVDPPVGSPLRPRGLLAVAAPAPEGWEQGGIEFSVACPAPIVRDKCVTLTPQEGVRPTLAEFPAFQVEQLVECSTLSGDARAQEARDALNVSTDYALGLTLRTGEANAGAPALDDADDLGDFADVLAAVSAIECAAASAAHGLEYVLHATPGAATYLAAANLIDDYGRSPAGASWIISPGYECDENGEHRIWATGRVVAAAGEITVRDAIDRLRNNREAWADRLLIVGFNPCINLTATFALPAVDD